MSPKGYVEQVFGEEPSAADEGKAALIDVYASDAAIIRTARPDDPALARKAKLKLIKELSRHATPEDIDKLPFPAGVDNPAEKLEIIAEAYIDGKADEAKGILLEQDIPVRVPVTDDEGVATGKVIPVSPQKFFGITPDTPVTPDTSAQEDQGEVKPEPKTTTRRAIGASIMKKVTDFLHRKPNTSTNMEP